MHRDEASWQNPTEFNPDRFLVPGQVDSDAFQPFAKGSRNCIGQQLAIIEAKAIMVLTLRFFDFQPAFRANSETIPDWGGKGYQVVKLTAKPKMGFRWRWNYAMDKLVGYQKFLGRSIHGLFYILECWHREFQGTSWVLATDRRNCTMQELCFEKSMIIITRYCSAGCKYKISLASPKFDVSYFFVAHWYKLSARGPVMNKIHEMFWFRGVFAMLRNLRSISIKQEWEDTHAKDRKAGIDEAQLTPRLPYMEVVNNGLIKSLLLFSS